MSSVARISFFQKRFSIMQRREKNRDAGAFPPLRRRFPPDTQSPTQSNRLSPTQAPLKLFQPGEHHTPRRAPLSPATKNAPFVNAAQGRLATEKRCGTLRKGAKMALTNLKRLLVANRGEIACK